MAKKKEMTLRQQMRAQACDELNTIIEVIGNTVADTLAKMNCQDLYSVDVMKLCSSTQISTLRAKLIGQLADRSERDLVEMWNNQQDLGLEKKDGE